MRHENSVFHSLTKHIPWNKFEQLVERHGSDYRVRRLDSKGQFLAMLFAQLSGASSLREVEAGLASHASQLYHLGAKRAARSTLADANSDRPSALFEDLFTEMVATAGRQTRRKLADVTRILDATRIELSSLHSDWAALQNSKRTVKLHLAYDPNGDVPLKAELTQQRVADVIWAKALCPEPGATYVFDLAYYDFTWWAKLDTLGCRIVTRLKSHTHLDDTTEMPVLEDGNVLSDRIGWLPQSQRGSRRHTFEDPVREVTVRISTGKVIRILTNDLDAPAGDIAELYKQRWQIELFFKWIKQNLKIKHFMGNSENAVRTQVFVALTAYILLRMAQSTQESIKQPLAFARLVRLNLMQRRSIKDLKSPFNPPPQDTRQMNFELGQC